jgi:hypothetical protein
MQILSVINKIFPAKPLLRTFFFFALICLLSGHVAVLFAQPKLEIIGGREFILGVIPEDTIVHKTLVVKNSGTDTLRIEHVRTSCGCTVAKPSSDRVAPNDSMEIPVSFNTKNFDGPVKKEIYFETNDSTSLRVDIVLLADIKALIEMRPHYLNFHEMNLNTPVVRYDTIKNNTSVTIRFDSIIVHNSQIIAKIRDTSLAAGRTTILETTVFPQKTGNIVGQMDIRTDYPSKPVLSLSYVGYVKK